MNKKEFLRELSFRLIFMKKDDKQAILDYYSEMIDDYVEDGYTEEEAVLKLGSIKSIIKNIIPGYPKLLTQKVLWYETTSFIYGHSCHAFSFLRSSGKG